MAPAVPDRAGRFDSNQVVAQQLDEVARDLRISIVEAVRPAVVEMLAATHGAAHPAQLRRAFEEKERQAGSMRVERDPQACRSASENGEFGHLEGRITPVRP